MSDVTSTVLSSQKAADTYSIKLGTLHRVEKVYKLGLRVRWIFVMQISRNMTKSKHEKGFGGQDLVGSVKLCI